MVLAKATHPTNWFTSVPGELSSPCPVGKLLLIEHCHDRRRRQFTSVSAVELAAVAQLEFGASDVSLGSHVRCNTPRVSSHSTARWRGAQELRVWRACCRCCHDRLAMRLDCRWHEAKHKPIDARSWWSMLSPCSLRWLRAVVTAVGLITDTGAGPCSEGMRECTAVHIVRQCHACRCSCTLLRVLRNYLR